MKTTYITAAADYVNGDQELKVFYYLRMIFPPSKRHQCTWIVQEHQLRCTRPQHHPPPHL